MSTGPAEVDGGLSDALTDGSADAPGDGGFIDLADIDAPEDGLSDAAPDVTSDRPIEPVDGSCPSPTTFCGGACVDVENDRDHCGDCAPCALAHVAVQICRMGRCVVGGCAPGYVDCDLTASNGCEGHFADDVRNCGGCGRRCLYAHAAGACTAGTCSLGACDEGYSNCDGDESNGCEVDLSDVTHCGPCGMTTACAAPVHGRATCVATRCDFVCDRDFTRIGATCHLTPRPIAPLSTATVTSHRPTLRWALAEGDSAHITLCRDRALSTGCIAFDSTGTSVRPTADLVPGVWFWRLTARVAGAATEVVGATWQFTVGPRSTPVDSSWGTTPDFNGDGYADVLVAARGRLSSTGTVYLYRGGPGGVATVPAATLTGVVLPFSARVESAGDVNGDGFADILTRGGTGRHFTIHFGGAGGLRVMDVIGERWPALVDDVAAAGDVNGDGYGDIVAGYAGDETYWNGRVDVYFGGPEGPAAAPSDTRPGEYHTELGASVRGAGDVNGDGFADVVALAIGMGVVPPDWVPPAAHVFLGGPGGLTWFRSISAEALERPATHHVGSIDEGGDINGDGYADVVVGVWDAAPAFPGPAGALVAYGGAGRPSPASQVRSDESASNYLSVSNLGDFDGDGFTDFGIHVGSALSGPTRIFRGSASGLTQSAILFEGGTPYYQVASAGDVDGDGDDDVIVGTPEVDGGVGSALLYFGSPTGLPSMPSQRLMSPAGPGGGFGAAVASITRPRGRWTRRLARR